ESYGTIAAALEAVGSTVFDGELWDVDPTLAVTLGRALRSLSDERMVAWERDWEPTFRYRIAIPVGVAMPKREHLTWLEVIAGIKAWRMRNSAWLSELPSMPTCL